MPIKQYIRATTPEDAVEHFAKSDGKARFLAGGTDLLNVPGVPQTVIDIRGLLSYTRREGSELVIGATTTIDDLERWEELAEADGGYVRSCTHVFASWQIRNMATVGGNLVSAVPSADIAVALFVLDARAVLLGSRGSKEVPLEEIFADAHKSSLVDELLVEVRFPAPSPTARLAFEKVARNKSDIATINAAVLLEIEDGLCREVRVALGAVAPTPIRLTEVERALVGKEPTEENVEKAASLAPAAVTPITDHRASAEYRTHMSKVLTKRVLLRAASGGRRS
jgi:carbon-monoxide dehydrogenase medium subunit